ncbi:enoyl-CoA hydratase-related protein [Skermania piniformis]|uniref:HoxX n=1 Tax=Skermania pinensis TaxID=39122 RepID=A0ABX8SG02_9ACTN|nr:enoyl-CoA hydratase-related protein [Skermania piniformis]QXQ15545.1 HoxX [Skermania piniformis]
MRIANPSRAIRRARTRLVADPPIGSDPIGPAPVVPHQLGTDPIPAEPAPVPPVVHVLFLVTAVDGLTQRAALALREMGHTVRVVVVSDTDDLTQAMAAADFELIICPYPTVTVPEPIRRRYPTVGLYPGPPGDRGLSSLDWALMNGETTWGVTAFAAGAGSAEGPVLAARSFGIGVARKSSIYKGPVADAAVECVREVVAGFTDPEFRPMSLPPVPLQSEFAGRKRSVMSQATRAFHWTDGPERICRTIRAADGSPGVLAELANYVLYVYDAHPDGPVDAAPGTIVAKQYGALRVAAGDTGSVWIGHARLSGEDRIKLPATLALPDVAAMVPTRSAPSGYPGVHYRREGAVGHVSFSFYNGAMSTEQSRRLTRALLTAARDDTGVILLTGGTDYFSNGIHLNVIEDAVDPAHEAWENVVAINGVARAILECRSKVIVAAFTGDANAGGAMLPLGADVVVARAGVVLNPHYATMGLFGSELHTYTLPERVGGQVAARLTRECLPISARQALRIGLVDQIGPRNPAQFQDWLSALAQHYAGDAWQATMATKTLRLDDADPVINSCERFELGQTMADLFDDRGGFAARRHAFVR